MNWRAVWAIARKDVKVALQNKGVSIPLIVVPVLMLGLMPALAAFAPALQSVPGAPFAGMDGFFEQMPAGLERSLAGLDEAQAIVVLALVYLMAPMYLILPLMVASVIAADSFAGEKERKTLEALLYTPTTDGELLLAKMLGAWLPAVAIAWGGFLLYGTVASLAAWPTMGRLLFPNAMWLVLALWVAPAVAGTGLGVTVLVSARASTFQEAYQLGGVVVVPVIVLVVGQATGVMVFNVGLVALLGLVFWLLDAALLMRAQRAWAVVQVFADAVVLRVQAGSGAIGRVIRTLNLSGLWVLGLSDWRILRFRRPDRFLRLDRHRCLIAHPEGSPDVCRLQKPVRSGGPHPLPAPKEAARRGDGCPTDAPEGDGLEQPRSAARSPISTRAAGRRTRIAPPSTPRRRQCRSHHRMGAGRHRCPA